MDTDPALTVDAGTYDVLRRRLAAHAAELARRAEALNARRTEAFGSTELRLLATEQIRTEQPSLPRDLVAVGGQLLFGFERGPGARGEAAVADVLALYGPDLAGSGDTLLADEAFVREFTALHRYFRDARLLRLRRVDGRLLAVFRTGETADDIRVLRWALAPDGSPDRSSTRAATVTTSSRRRTTSPGPRRDASRTSPAGTRTSRSGTAAPSSSTRSAAP